MTKYGILREKGLPSPLVIHDKLMTRDDYIERLNKLASSQASTSGVKALPTGKVLYDNLKILFFLEHEINHLFINKPNFVKYTKANEIYRKILRMKLPEGEWCEKMTDLL